MTECPFINSTFFVPSLAGDWVGDGSMDRFWDRLYPGFHAVGNGFGDRFAAWWRWLD